jgi:hypothetical protein
MKNLPKGMIPDRDNIVYFDTEVGQFYFIEWVYTGNNDIPHRHHILIDSLQKPRKEKK